MKSPIVFVGGSKGGVGKSLVSMATIDFLQQRENRVILIETDDSNADSFKCYRDEVDIHILDLEKDNDWIALVDICEAEDAIVVVNTAARNNYGIKKHSGILVDSLPELERELITLWVINNQKDSIELLVEYLESIKTGKIHVIKNQLFGDEREFDLYNNCNTKKLIESKGGKSLNFPVVANRVTDALYNDRLSIAKAAAKMSIGNRAELNRWRNIVKNILEEVFDDS
jgi:hypothetical protein